MDNASYAYLVDASSTYSEGESFALFSFFFKKEKERTTHASYPLIFEKKIEA